MPLLADEDHGAHRLVPGVQVAGHAVLGSEGLHRRAQRVGAAARAGELHAHEKAPAVAVVELRRLLDIAALLQQKTRDGVHDAGLVLAGQGEYVGVLHGPELSQFTGLDQAPRPCSSR